MFTTYRVVWVSPENPGIVEDVDVDGIEDILEAEECARVVNNTEHTDGLDWFARIQRVTHEFI